MCFSAGASFTAAGVLAVIGAASVASSDDRTGHLFAAIPLGFAAQQAAEGLVWLTVDAPAHRTIHHIAVFAFLAFALVIWPTWVPLSLRRAERDGDRRRWLTWLMAIGVLVSLGAVMLLIHWQPRAFIDDDSVHYAFGGATGALVHALLLSAYALPTLVPFFIATIDLSKVFGIALALSMAAAAAIKYEALTSVWCFFAAALSVLVLMSVRRRRMLTNETVIA
jgi:hypothetical protein